MTLGSPTVVDPSELESTVPEPALANADLDRSEAETVPDFTDLPEPAFDQSAGLPEFQMKASSLDVPVSPAVVELPESNHEQEDSSFGPPGLEPERAAVSLEDSWFGEEDEPDTLHDDVPDSVESDPIEDPGFADVSEVAEVGFDDTSWSPNGVPATHDSSIPKGMMFGGIAVLAAAVALTVLFSGEDSSSIPPPAPASAPVVEVQQAAPEAPAPSVQAEATDSGEAVVADEPNEEAEVLVAAVVAIEEEDAGVGSAVVPVVVPPPTPPVASPPPAPAPPAPPAPPPAARTAKANPPSVWTGSPAANDSAPSAPASNPWGAPAEVASRGRLTITTEPAGAVVFVDDRRIGRSPTQTEVTYGNHTVRVEMVDYRTNSRSVSIQAGEVSVPFRLAPAALVGRCNLLGEPGAAVSMNGTAIGSLPLTVECAPGVHRFDITPASGGETFILSKAVTFVHSGETENIFLNP
jgi:hypothetical protein